MIEAADQPSATGKSGKRRKRVPALELTLDGQTLRFRNSEDFAFALAGRAQLPTARIADLVDAEPADLRFEIEAIKRIERQLLELLEWTLVNQADCMAQLQSLGLQAFSKDHGWRSLFEHLIALDSAYAAYRKVALVKYVRYLEARRTALGLFASQGHIREAGREDDSSFLATAQVIVAQDLIDTLEEPHALLRTEFQRLPAGEAVELSLAGSDAITLILGVYPAQLNFQAGWILRAPDGGHYPLRAGRTSIGRGRANDISLARGLNKLSRRHLLIEPLSDTAVLITDLSSQGTYAACANIVR